MRRRPALRRGLAAALLAWASARGDPPAAALPAPAGATRLATFQIRVAPDRPDWTYALNAPVTFTAEVDADGQPVAQATLRYRLGPETYPGPERTAATDSRGRLRIAGGTMGSPGFLRCVVTYDHAGRSYRGLATAGFAPAAFVPTQAEPADFDAFWARGKAALARIPPAARLTLLPDRGTAGVDVYQVSLQHVGGSAAAPPSRLYGILCEPKGAGPFPAVLYLPGAGVRPFPGQRELAERGFITLELGIHGIPVDLPPEVYAQLQAGALAGYARFNLDDREAYYYRRVYLGCIRADDFLVSRPRFNGRLAVRGGSQGGQLAIATAALDPRVAGLVAMYPAYCDVTGYLHGRAGDWPHLFRDERPGSRIPAQIATTAYYDTVNFARRLRVPGYYSWGYNDETCPPTSVFAAYNVMAAPRTLALALERGHSTGPEQGEAADRWLEGFLRPAE